MVLWYYDRLQYNVDYIRGLNDPGMVRLSIYVISLTGVTMENLMPTQK